MRRLARAAQATVLLGNDARGGQHRLLIKAADHDFQPDEQLTPSCRLLPDHDRASLDGTHSRVTSDFMADG
jgi:hypothetical protein